MVSRAGISVLLVSLLSAAGGCSSTADDSTEGMAAVSDANAVIEIHPLDIWGQTLPTKDVRVTVKHDGNALPVEAAPTIPVYVAASGDYEVTVEAPYHEPLTVHVNYNGTSETDGASVKAEPGQGIAFGHTERQAAGRSLTTHSLYLGLRHKFFSAEGRPARRGNNIRLMIDGQTAFTSMREDMQKASKEIHLSTWWWESEMEMVRDGRLGKTAEERKAITLLGTLEKLPATKRVLVGQFWGQDSVLKGVTNDKEVRAYAKGRGDNFEMMGQGNETRGRFEFKIPDFAFGDRVQAMQEDVPSKLEVNAKVPSTVPARSIDLTQVPLGADIELASYHQKFGVIDGRLAYVGGMNLRQNDWDTAKHEVFDARRMSAGAPDADLQQVINKTKATDDLPRKDYMVRLEGPSVQDVSDVFHQRWESQRKRGVLYSNATTEFKVARDIKPLDNGIQVQLTTTLPQPFWEHSIAETWFNAVRNAEQYIYIEDQYFRVPMLNEAIATRMKEKPELKLIVITQGVLRIAPECYQTNKQNEFFRTQFPDRYLTLQLRSYDQPTNTFSDINTHSKMLIVDDIFMSVGSANKNNRGLVYEAEMNLAIVDPSVGQMRKEILANLLGVSETNLTPEQMWKKLRAVAESNDVAYQSKGDRRPEGFVYPLAFGAPSACLFTNVGPDAT